MTGRAAAVTRQGRAASDAMHLAQPYRRLGELYEEKGDARRAIDRYEDFIHLWNNADRERQPIVTDVRTRIATLPRRIG